MGTGEVPEQLSKALVGLAQKESSKVSQGGVTGKACIWEALKQ